MSLCVHISSFAVRMGVGSQKNVLGVTYSRLHSFGYEQKKPFLPVPS